MQTILVTAPIELVFQGSKIKGSPLVLKAFPDGKLTLRPSDRHKAFTAHIVEIFWRAADSHVLKSSRLIASYKRPYKTPSTDASA